MSPSLNTGVHQDLGVKRVFHTHFTVEALPIKW